MRSAAGSSQSVVELRAICAEAGDYANPIEPPGEGGRKIAMAVAGAVGAIEGASPSRVWAQPC